MDTKIETQYGINEISTIYNERDNYEVKEFDIDSNLCAIYFSGHGVYYPNTSEAFHEIITIKDRYEWKSNILKSARKVIFIRDIKKQWYLDGINQHINSIEKVCELLRKESQGHEVICIGSSAGGYAATLIGCCIGATHVFNFSGQFSLLPYLRGELNRHLNQILANYEHDPARNTYFSLLPFLQRSNTKVFYFFPAQCDEDIEQFELVKSCPNIYAFAFKTTIHAQTCYLINLVDLFDLSLKELVTLHRRFAHQVIEPYLFSIQVSGYRKTFRFLLSLQLKRCKTFLQTLLKRIKKFI